MASSWLATITIRDAGSSASSIDVRPRHVEHDVAIVPRRGVDQPADARRIHRRRDRAIGRRQQREAGLGMADQAVEERLVEPMDVLERVDHREARLGAEEDRGIAVGEVQIDRAASSRATAPARSRR